MTEHEHNSHDIVEQAIISRLRGLKRTPVDTHSLEAIISRQIPRPRQFWQRMWRPVAAIAASIMIIVAVGIALSINSSEAHASPAMMAQIHRDIITGKVATMDTHNLDEANKAIAAMVDGSLQLPQIPLTHKMSCCMREVKDRKMACVLFEKEGVPVTISIAKASDFKGPRHDSVMSADGIQMIMMERNGMWICMMAEMPAEQLKALADKMRF